MATAAGIDALVWSADIDQGGHVFDGEGGYIGSRNIGRLPFVEFFIQSATEDQQSYQGGVGEYAIIVRCHVGGIYQSDVDELAGEILFQSVRAIRNMAGDQGRIGSSSYGQTALGPWGSQRDVVINIQLSVEI